MVFRIILSTIVILLCGCIVDAVTVNLNPAPIEVVITGWDYIWCDGKEIRIYVSKGSTSINLGVVPRTAKGR